jgi:hypothetical protein
MRVGVVAWMIALSIACGPAVHVPRFEYGGEAVCADVLAVARTANGLEEFVASVDLKSLGFKVGEAYTGAGETYSVNLADGAPARAFVNVYPRPAGRTPYCSDMDDGPEPTPTVWSAISGTVHVKVLPLAAVPYPQGDYQIEITFKDLRFRGPNGQVIQPPALRPLRGSGGWLGG